MIDEELRKKLNEIEGHVDAATLKRINELIAEEEAEKAKATAMVETTVKTESEDTIMTEPEVTISLPEVTVSVPEVTVSQPEVTVT